MFDLSYRDFIKLHGFREHKDHVWFCLQDALGAVVANEIAGGRKLSAFECAKLYVRLLMSPSWNPTSPMHSLLKGIDEVCEETPVFALYAVGNAVPPFVVHQVTAGQISDFEFSHGDKPLLAIHVVKACNSPGDFKLNTWVSDEQAMLLAQA